MQLQSRAVALTNWSPLSTTMLCPPRPGSEFENDMPCSEWRQSAREKAKQKKDKVLAILHQEPWLMLLKMFSTMFLPIFSGFKRWPSGLLGFQLLIAKGDPVAWADRKGQKRCLVPKGLVDLKEKSWDLLVDFMISDQFLQVFGDVFLVTPKCWPDWVFQKPRSLPPSGQIYSTNWCLASRRYGRFGAANELQAKPGTNDKEQLWALSQFFEFLFLRESRSIKVTFPDDMVAPADIKEEDVRSFLAPTVPRSVALGWTSDEGRGLHRIAMRGIE